MKIIGFEEHYTLPAIADANPNSPSQIIRRVTGRQRVAAAGHC